MLTSQRPKAVLMLHDGTRFEGRAFGAAGTTVGEICFSTALTGYQEAITDPGNAGRILVMAASHVGNYGVKRGADALDGEDEGPGVSIAGLVVKRNSQVWSRAGATGSLDGMLGQAGTPGISDIDTRQLVQHIRDHGAQKAIIDTTGMDEMALRERLAAATKEEQGFGTGEAYELGDPAATHRVAVLDLGLKRSVLRQLLERGCLVRVFPWNTEVPAILAWKPDGFLLGHGPGDPTAMPDAVEQVKAVVETGLPVFGISLGHLLLARGLGIGVRKTGQGSQGLNRPVHNTTTGRNEVAALDHGYEVDRRDVEAHPEVEVTHEHLNEGRVVGMRLKGRPVFSVQHHPEGGAGPLDPLYLFDEFVQHMQEHKERTRKKVQPA